MKKTNFLCMISIFALLTSSLASAQGLVTEGGAMHGGGTGPLGQYLSCGSSKHGFQIRSTAAPSYIQGLYTSGTNAWNFSCVKVNRDLAPGAPTAGKILWQCDEATDSPTNEGIMQVRVIEGGVTGVKTAEISKKQIFPLQNHVIETLGCR